MTDERRFPAEDGEESTVPSKRLKLQHAADNDTSIRTTINYPDYSDIVFVCKDGGKVYAARSVLVDRCEFFNRMLTNGMAESEHSIINMHEVSSQELLPVVEFVYTGALERHRPKDWRNAFEIIGTAKFFLLEGLELIATRFLQREAEDLKLHIHFEKVASFVNVAAEFATKLGEVVNALVRDLVCYFFHKLMEPKQLQLLSGVIFSYCLEATQLRGIGLGHGSTAEFARFRNIVLWCACEQFASRTGLNSRDLPQEIKLILELLDKSPDLEQPMTSYQAAMYSNLREPLAEAFHRYLPHVDLRQIPPSFIVRIVEPLGITPSAVVIDALGFQALKFDGALLKVTTPSKWSTCMDNDLYACNTPIQTDQAISSNGFATYSSPMINADGMPQKTYEWEIVIEEVCNDFIEIGLHRYENGLTHLIRSLSHQPGGWALRMDGMGMSINRTGPRYQVDRYDTKFSPYGGHRKNRYRNGTPVYGIHYGQKNCKVKVQLVCGELSRCSFTVDDVSLGRAWSYLPTGTFYPAVSLGKGSTGAARIRMLKICEP